MWRWEKWGGGRRNGTDLRPGVVCGLSSRNLLTASERARGQLSAMVSCQVQALKGTLCLHHTLLQAASPRALFPLWGGISHLFRKQHCSWTHDGSVQTSVMQCGQGQDGFPGQRPHCPRPHPLAPVPHRVARKSTRSHQDLKQRGNKLPKHPTVCYKRLLLDVSSDPRAGASFSSRRPEALSRGNESENERGRGKFWDLDPRTKTF